MTIDEIMNFEPQIASVQAGTEPSLKDLLLHYYLEHMPMKDAVKCRDKYLLELNKAKNAKI